MGDYNNENGNRDRSRSPMNRRKSRPNDALLKMLIPNSCTGAILGKGGANLKDMKEKNNINARLDFSKPGVLYPTMQDRIALITGGVDDIVTLSTLLAEKVIDDNADDVLKLILPNSTAGLIIGKNGQEIKQLNDETGAKVIIRSPKESPVEAERVLVITGPPESRLEALKRIVSVIAPDEINVRHNRNMDYAGRQTDRRDDRQDDRRDRRDDRRDDRDRRDNRNGYDDHMGGNDFGLGNLLGSPPLHAILQQQTNINPGPPPAVNAMANLKISGTINMEIPTIVVNQLNSNELSDFMQFSGAQIDVSNRPSGSGDQRMLTIFGNLEQVQAGYILVGQRIQSIVRQLTSEAQRGMKR